MKNKRKKFSITNKDTKHYWIKHTSPLRTSSDPPIPDSLAPGFEQLPETNTFELKEDVKVLQEEPVEERTYENTQFICKIKILIFIQIRDLFYSLQSIKARSLEQI